MNLAASQQALIEDYQLIEDSQERFSAIVDHGRKAPPFPVDARREENLVPGCTSRVWLIGHCRDGLCQFQAEAESTILQGIIALLMELYSGHPPSEVISVEPEILQKLHIFDHLSPTRRNGLRHIRARMIEIAQESG